jgi:predicted nucleic acid-binding protein
VRFVDTDVLLYAISCDPHEQDRARRANEVLAARDLAVSVQVLEEFYVRATRRSRPDPLTHSQAVRLVESFLRFPVAEMTTGVVLAALRAHVRFQISYRDAAILEASRSLGCHLVLSEAFCDGADYGGVVVENPFRGA